jgi:hypothetical protein
MGSLVVRVCQKVSKSVTSQGQRQGWGETLAREVGGAERGWRVGREARESRTTAFHPTWEEAYQWRLDKLQQELDQAIKTVRYCERALDKARTLKPEGAKPWSPITPGEV